MMYMRVSHVEILEVSRGYTEVLLFSIMDVVWRTGYRYVVVEAKVLYSGPSPRSEGSTRCVS